MDEGENLIDSAKKYYHNTFLQLISKFNEVPLSKDITHHQKLTYNQIIADIQLLFQPREEEIVNNHKELIYLTLFELINRISGCLEDSVSEKDELYFNRKKIQRFRIHTESTFDWKETLRQIRGLFGMIFAKLYKLINLMLDNLIESLRTNNQELYYGIIQTMEIPTFYHLLFEADIGKLLDYKIKSSISQLETDSKIYNYAKFVSSIIKPLHDFSQKNIDENETIIFLTFLSFNLKEYNCSYQEFVQNSTELILSIVHFELKATDWEIYPLMKIFTQINSVSYEFVEDFQNSILDRLTSMKKSLFLAKINGIGFKIKREDNCIFKLAVEKEIWKFTEIIRFLNSFKWIDIERVKTLEINYRKLLQDVEEGRKKENLI